MPRHIIPKLEKLKESGMIVDYALHNVSDDGIVGKESDYRNTEMLLIKFPNGESLSINTFCSGSAEDTVMMFE